MYFAFVWRRWGGGLGCVCVCGVGGGWLGVVGWLEFEMALSDNQNINSLQSIDNSFVAPPYYCTLLVLGHYGFYIYIFTLSC